VAGQAAKGPSPSGAVLVTGASSGIGRACALRLDARGFRVFAGFRRQPDADALARDGSARLVPVRLDVTDAGSIASAAEAVAAAVGSAGLQGLVNNAGIVVAGPLEVLPLAALRRQLEVNVIGQVAVTQAFLPLLRRGGGRVVNMGSISGRLASPLLGAYAASKFSLEAITDALRLELRPWGLPVSLVEPGAIATAIWERSRVAADEMAQELSAEARGLYAPAVAAVRAAADRASRAAIPADAVARAVEHALTAARPRTRYLVGRDARIRAALAWLLPDRVRDALIARALGLPGAAPDSGRGGSA
jgi:NAD(P)-dependent dehydrogenase (short-subunit alcohol dehydrogenase family)